jgi:hypothetical protein
MIITRIISIGIVVMFALIATFDAVYAESPCCTYRNGVYVNLKTGKPVTPPTSTIKASAPKTGGPTGASNPAPSGAADHGGGGGGRGGGGHK